MNEMYQKCHFTEQFCSITVLIKVILLMESLFSGVFFNVVIMHQFELPC